jgi:hypothetical protein
METLRSIPEFSRYVASSAGYILSMSRGTKMKPYVNRKGYLIVGLRGDESKTKCIPVHRVIWMAFNGPIPKGLVVDHIDNNPGNNRINNLQLLSNRENVVKGKVRKPRIRNYTGVGTYYTKSGVPRFTAKINHKKQALWLGTFPTETMAKDAYARALNKILNG